MSEEMPCCAHTRVVNRNNDNGSGTITREWWQCSDCKTEFLPSRAVSYEIEKLRADLAIEREGIAQAARSHASMALQLAKACDERDTERPARESLEKERDGLALLIHNNRPFLLRRFSVAEHDTEFHLRSECTCPDCEDYRNLEPIEEYAENVGKLLAAHDARLTAPLERRVVEQAETLRSDAAFLRHYLQNYVVGVQVRDERGNVTNSFAAAQIPDWAVKQRLDDIEAALASTPREGTEEPKS